MLQERFVYNNTKKQLPQNTLLAFQIFQHHNTVYKASLQLPEALPDRYLHTSGNMTELAMKLLSQVLSLSDRVSGKMTEKCHQTMN